MNLLIRRRIRGAFVAGSLLALGIADGERVSSQAPTTVDFARDVQPILAERCVGCHGPSRQEAGYRLDRRSGALSGTLRPNIIRGSSDSSPLYHRIAGSRRGPQMPPTGALSAAQIATIRRWIDEGAQWPDALAQEVVLAVDPGALRMIGAIRSDDSAAVRQQLRDTPTVASARGDRGSTPLMYAAVRGDARLVADMLNAGASPNVGNDLGATALMWGVEHVAVLRALLDAGADPNATSQFNRTAVTLAAMLPDGDAAVDLLLRRGAKPLPAALTVAAQHGRVPTMRRLLMAGARDGGAAAVASLRIGCTDCFEALLAAQPIPPLRDAMAYLLPPGAAGEATAIRLAVEHGADLALADSRLQPVAIRAAMAARLAPETVQFLAGRGMDVTVKDANGGTAPAAARHAGNGAVAEALLKAGASGDAGLNAPSRQPAGAASVEAAVRRSLPLLQRTATQFYTRSGCVSCHHNSIAQMIMPAARQAGFDIDLAAAQRDVALTVRDINDAHEQAIQGIVAPGGMATTTGYILMGLSAADHRADAGTDALVRLLRIRQLPDGRWSSVYRPPVEASDITATAVAVRGLQLYGSRNPRSADARAVASASKWLQRARPIDTEDLAFRLLGLIWSGAANVDRQAAARNLLAVQRADGGWSQLPTLPSDAYATGVAMAALWESGAAEGAAYRGGISFLLKTQFDDGSWHVASRSHPTQIYFESGFPYGPDQFISAAATNWATLALIRSRQPAANDTAAAQRQR